MGKEQKIKDLWKSIEFIYINKGKNFHFENIDLRILSNDNLFTVQFKYLEKVFTFVVAVEYSFVHDPQYTFIGSDGDVDFYYSKLNPILRDLKLDMIICE